MTASSTPAREDREVSDRLRTIPLGEAMRPDPLSCSQDATAAEIAEIMSNNRPHSHSRT